MKIKELFIPEYGNVRSINNYEKGIIPYVSSGFKNNGVLGFVDTDEELFPKNCITVAAKGSIGSCFVQPIDFIASKDNVVVLKEKEGVKLSIEEKYCISAYINSVKWKYSYGRTLSKTRVGNININIEFTKIKKLIDYREKFNSLLPQKKQKIYLSPASDFADFKITEIFEIRRGIGGYLISYENGPTPLISATNQNNGIKSYVNDEPAFCAPCITVERVSGSAFVQIDDFVTVPDDVSVLVPKFDVPAELLYYVSSLISSRKWKYCYGRKLSKGRLEKMTLRLPIIKKGSGSKVDVNMDYIKNMVNIQYGWDMIKAHIKN